MAITFTSESELEQTLIHQLIGGNHNGPIAGI